MLSCPNKFIEGGEGGGWGESLIVGSSLRSVYFCCFFRLDPTPCAELGRTYLTVCDIFVVAFPFRIQLAWTKIQSLEKTTVPFGNRWFDMTTNPKKSKWILAKWKWKPLYVWVDFGTFGGSWLVWKGCKCDLLSNICPSMSGSSIPELYRSYILKVHQNAFLSLLQTRSSHNISTIFYRHLNLQVIVSPTQISECSEQNSLLSRFLSLYIRKPPIHDVRLHHYHPNFEFQRPSITQVAKRTELVSMRRLNSGSCSCQRSFSHNHGSVETCTKSKESQILEGPICHRNIDYGRKGM